MAALYGISEEAAADRLASEIVAASQYQLMHSLDLKGYAGGWYDADSARLVVATNHASDRNLLSAMNINSILVDHDLSSLQELAENLAAEFRTYDTHQAFRSAFVDVRANQAVLVVAPEARHVAEDRVGYLLLNGRGAIRTQAHTVETSSGNVRAAKATRNLTWNQHPGGDWPCSIGANTENGFVWAGHCGYRDNIIGDEDETPLGEVAVSTWLDSSEKIDVGKVETSAGWTPTPTVQGYNHGVIDISSIRSGLTEYPINSTVCRYGGTSKFANCGTIDAKNVSITPSGKSLEGMTRVTGICSDDGDSGGPHIAGGSHMQGVNIAKTDEPSSCPTPLQYVYFHRMTDVLDRTGSTMLTSHGSNQPSAYDLICPDSSNSWNGHFLCTTSFMSQGPTNITWTYGSTQVSGPLISGSCSPGSTVFIDLSISNSYGTDAQNISFPCPTGIIQ